MRPKDKAQTTTEYIALITMLGLALALGWDFISEGVMGGVKNLTRSEEIATREVIRQSNTTGGQIPFCNCGPIQTGPSCGVELAGASINCNDRQKYYRKNCTGPGCTSPIEEWCQYDESCCEDLGPEPPGGVNHCWPNYCSAWGLGQHRQVCGALTNPIQFICKPDTVCNFQCGYDTITSTVTSTQVAGSVLCPGDNNSGPNKVSANNLPWVRVNNLAGCTAGNPCESYCPPGKIYSSTSNACEDTLPSRTVADMRCLCLSGSGESQGQSPCVDPGVNEGPFLSKPQCMALTNILPPEPCPHRGWARTRDAMVTCPQGLVLDSGNCLWASRPGGEIRAVEFFVTPAGNPNPAPFSRPTASGDGWECLFRPDGSGGDTCHRGYVEAMAFCVPPPGGPQPVLVDFVVQAGSCPAGYHSMFAYRPGWNGWYQYRNPNHPYYCSKVEEFAAYEPCTTYAAVIGDVWFTGDYRDHPVNPPVAHRSNYFRADQNYNAFCPEPNPHPIVGGSSAANPPKWSAFGWDGNATHTHCKRDVRASEQKHCLADASCPAANQRQVIQDLAVTWNGTPNPPACSTLGAGWVSAGVNPVSQIRFCKKHTTICVY